MNAIQSDCCKNKMKLSNTCANQTNYQLRLMHLRQKIYVSNGALELQLESWFVSHIVILDIVKQKTHSHQTYNSVSCQRLL